MKLINKIALLNIELVKPYMDDYEKVVSFLKSDGDAGCCDIGILSVPADMFIDNDDSRNSYYAINYAITSCVLGDSDHLTLSAVRSASRISHTSNKLIELLKGDEHEITEKK